MAGRFSMVETRKIALAAVPIASIFYCSNPLAAALTRRRVQLFYFILGLTHIPQFVQLVQWSRPAPFVSQHFKFTILYQQVPSTQCPYQGFNDSNNLRNLIKSVCSLTFPIALTLDSAIVFEERCNVTVEGNHYFFSFKSPVEWNGWYFEYDESLSSHTNIVRFSLYVHDEKQIESTMAWKQIGSSTLLQLAGTTIFLNGDYLLPRSSDRPKTFPLKDPRPYSFVLARAVGGCILLALALLAAIGRVSLATFFPTVFSVAFIAHQLVEATRSPPFPGDRTALASTALGCTEVGAFFFNLQRQYVYMSIWYGACWLCLAIGVLPYGPEGRRCALFLTGIGAPFLFAGVTVKVSQLLTRTAACRALEEDRQHYDALWSEILTEPSACAALDAIATAADAAAIACSPAAGAYRPAPRQEGGVRPVGLRRLWELLQREPEEGCILADLARVYAAAAAADALLREMVLEVARDSGGLLPAVGGGKATYVRVMAWTVVEDVAWTPLKGKARALEKARRP